LPSFATIRNPLDITGFVLADVKAATSGAGDASLNAVADDPSVDFIFNALTVPVDEPPDPAPLHRRLAGIATTQSRIDKPIIHFMTTCTDLSPFAREVLAGYGLHVLGGIEFGIKAVGHALRWSAMRQRGVATRPGIPAPRTPVGVRRAGPWSEAAGRELLLAHGVPVVPAELATSVDAAVAA